MSFLLEENIQGMIIDMDGVLWRANEPLGDLPALFARMQAAGCRVIMATNNSSLSPRQYLDKLQSFGVNLEPWQVINSSQATAHYLHGIFPDGGPVYVIGEQGLHEALAEYNFFHDEEQAQAVVSGLDRGLTYEKLRKATLLIRSGAPFVGTNPDRTFPMPYGLVPGAGSILAALEAATGVAPVVLGKPAPGMYQVALERLGTLPEATLAIGDRLDTDIAGGQALGCPTALVLSGVTSAAEVESWEPVPTLIAADLTQLLQNLFPDNSDTQGDTG